MDIAMYYAELVQLCVGLGHRHAQLKQLVASPGGSPRRGLGRSVATVAPLHRQPPDVFGLALREQPGRDAAVHVAQEPGLAAYRVHAEGRPATL
jgi:hypothetical protein